jgi:hypothetical protein
MSVFCSPSVQASKYEALELRDKEERYGGLGVQQAADHVNARIAPEVIGMNVLDQAAVDQTMIRLDGTKNKIIAIWRSFSRFHVVYVSLTRSFDKIASNDLVCKDIQCVLCGSVRHLSPMQI